jgi:uncharacterized integral membrane protein
MDGAPVSYDRQDRALDDGSSGDTGPPLKLIGLGVVAVLCVLFVVQNTDRHEVSILFWDINSRQWVNILVAIGLGVILDRLFLAWWRRSRRRRAD